MAGVFISAEKLRGFSEALLAAGGFKPDEAKVIAKSLTLSELSGHGSHGVMRVKAYISDIKKGDVVPGAKFKILNETSSSLLVDGQICAGQVVMPEILEKLSAKLQTQAIATASINNCAHIGRLGEWVEYAAQKGFACLLMVNDNGCGFYVAPPGGKTPVTSTNPIAFAIPLSGGDIFVSDMSTSAIAFGKARLARINGHQVPPNALQDAAGKSTTDPSVLSADPPGTILPMGGAQGYKGFALSMFVDMMTAGLSGGQTPPAQGKAVYLNNVSLTLWNPEFFAGLGHMQQQAEKYIAFVRNSDPVDPQKPVRLAGDRMMKLRHEREKTGIPLDDGLAKALLGLANELGVQPPPEFKEAA